MVAKRRASTRRTVSMGGAAVRGKVGKAPAGKVMTPSADAEFAALAAVPEAREPRPYKTRYPIPESEFVKLKERAHRVKLARGKASAVPDTGRKAELPA